jgi:hypothetical protein
MGAQNSKGVEMSAYRASKIAACAIGLAGCMLTPTDDGRVASTTAALPFEGFTVEPGAAVQIRAWNYTTNAMANVGAPVSATTTPFNIDGGPLYSWSASRALPPQFWRSGPGGAQCAAVDAQTMLSFGTFNVISVEQDWGDCFNEHPSAGEFFSSCASSNSPVAKIYTNSWAPVTVTQSQLNLAGFIASSQITLTLDNFTATQGQFCNSGNPGGCPPGLGGDPETYQFYFPNASSLTQSGSPPLRFSITPSRRDPMTVYIDNLRSTSLDFTTAGNRFVLGINFESTDPEIRMNCIRNFICGFVGNPTLEVDGARAVLSFALAVEAGRIVYTDVTATVTTTSTSGDSISAANSIAAAMADKLNNEPSIKSAVATAIDSVIRQSAGLTAFPVEGIGIGGGTIQVRAGCPLD